jgi:hypothetical protein
VQLVLKHQNGKQYRMPVDQVVVYNDDGLPVALTYLHDGLIVHTDLSATDFDQTCRNLRLERLSDV